VRLHRHSSNKEGPFIVGLTCADSEPKIVSFPFGSVLQNEAGVARLKLNGHFIDQIGTASDSWSHQSLCQRSIA
jgi:hypothetical protein